LRAKQVSDLKKLERYPYCGHSVLLGHNPNDWQSSATELARRIGITQPAISQSVKRGEAIAKENGFELMDS